MFLLSLFAYLFDEKELLATFLARKTRRDKGFPANRKSSYHMTAIKAQVRTSKPKVITKGKKGRTEMERAKEGLFFYHRPLHLEKERKYWPQHKGAEVQGSTNRRAPGCVNAAGKLRQKC